MEGIKKAKIGVSIGDLNGIGIELIIKSLSDNQICELCTPIIYASPKTISYHKNTLGEINFNYNTIKKAEEAVERRVNMIAVWEEEVNMELGTFSAEAGKYALKSLEAATNDLISNKVDALITAPINKKAIQSNDFHFPGHTEYLGNKANKKPLMLMVTNDLKIAVVTGHIPVNEIAVTITKELVLEKLTLLNESLKHDFLKERPKIAVLGLNPHAGDGGLLGNEEIDIIQPALEEAKKKNIFAIGSYSADAFFGNKIHKQFDAVLAMYHDQGLIPFKTLSFGHGVNFTAGLPFVRTSPDHGTAFDIAGKNMANPSSFREAIYAAIDIVKNRKG